MVPIFKDTYIILLIFIVSYMVYFKKMEVSNRVYYKILKFNKGSILKFGIFNRVI